MRIPRTILLGLSPLLSLWAMGAQMVSAPPGSLQSCPAEQRLTSDALQSFIEPVVSFLLYAAENASVSSSSAQPSPQFVLSLDALQSTSLHGSIWLVREGPPADLHSRRHQRPSLRC
jgi:hypothetical protein